MRSTVVLVAIALGASGCRFSPTVDGQPINTCDENADCPACGTCVDGVCVPQAPPGNAFELVADPPVVEAGEACRLIVVDVDPTCERTYHWRQLAGPDVLETDSKGSEQTLDTVNGYVGAYTFEAVTGQGDARRTARGSCTALESSEAAWIVPGTNGSCSRSDPCGSFDAARDPGDGRLPLRVYLGVEEAEADGTPVVIQPTGTVADYRVVLDFDWDPREVHGGFIFPGWRRDLERARTALSTPNQELEFRCSDCSFSGLSQTRAIPAGVNFDGFWGVSLLGANVTLRQSRVEQIADGASANNGSTAAVFLSNSGGRLEDVHILISGDFGDMRLIGVDAFVDVGFTGERLLVDMSAATSGTQQGFAIRRVDHLDRIRVATGQASVWSEGLFIDCGPARVTNALVDARLSRGPSSYGVSLGYDQGCAGPWALHSVFASGGSGLSSAGLLLSTPDAPGAVSVENSIFDAGQGVRRFAVGAGRFYQADTSSMRNTVLVVDPSLGAEYGVAGRDPDGTYTLDPEADPATVLGCVDCLKVVESIPFVDRENGDFHLRDDADCCVGQGAEIGQDDPTHDLDGRPRPAAPLLPTIGPYEPLPEGDG